MFGASKYNPDMRDIMVGLPYNLVLTVVLAFELACLVQTLLHRFVGHRPIIPWIFVNHTQSHHYLYTGLTFEQPAYQKDEQSITYTFIPVVTFLGALAFWLLPIELAVTAAATITLTFAANIYVHLHYHLKNSWLLRFGWFRTLKELHCIHHIDKRTNYGVLNLVWDRIMGTFASAPHPALRANNT